jgi:protein SCO1
MKRFLAFILVFVGLGSQFAAAQAPGGLGGQPAEPLPEYTIEQRLGEKVPLDLEFRDESGKTVKLGDYFGDGPVVLILAWYRCPRLCSMLLSGVIEGLQPVSYDIGKDYRVVTVSIDPRETSQLAAEKKRSILQRYDRRGADQGWHLLTGDEAAIKRLADAVGYRYGYDAARDLYGHASGIMMLSHDGTLTRYFYGVSFSPRELRYGLEDSAAGKIGSPIEQPLRMLCFAYDPATGKYSFMTMRLVRLLAAVTALALASYLVMAWRRERRRRSISVVNPTMS